MSETAKSRAGAMLVRLLIGLSLLALAGAVVFLLSERNARTYGVEQHGTELVIVRGRMLPAGTQPYAPADAALARAYAPIQLMGESAGGLLGLQFADRDELDRALFAALRRWIEPRVEVEDPARLRQAIDLLRRMEMLTGISDEQRRQLDDVRGRVAWFEGRVGLEEGLVQLRAAVEKLQRASDARGRYSREAGDLFDRVSPLAEKLGYQLRAARRDVAGNPAPPSVEPSTEAGRLPAEPERQVQDLGEAPAAELPEPPPPVVPAPDQNL